jgi:hypothetical protein
MQEMITLSFSGRQDPYAMFANDRFLTGHLSDKFQTIFHLGRLQNIRGRNGGATGEKIVS